MSSLTHPAVEHFQLGWKYLGQSCVVDGVVDALRLNVPDVNIRDPELRDGDEDHREDREEGEHHREDVEDPGDERGLGILEHSPDKRFPGHPPSHLAYNNYHGR